MSAPPVRIESKAWTDHRYKTLALELGLPDQNFALIMVATIWRWQTEHYTDAEPTYSVARSVVIGALGSKAGPEAMIAADLAELEPDGRLRIRGGYDDKGKSRIDWLWVERQQRKEAGIASAKRRKAAGDPRAAGGKFGDLSAGRPTGDQRATNETATDTERRPERRPSSPFSDLRSLPESLPLPRDPAGTGTGPTPPDPPPAPDRELGTLLEHAVDRLNAARREIDPGSRPLPMLVGGADASKLRDRLREVVPASDRRATLDHAIDVLAAEARDKRTVDDLRLGMLGGDLAWPRLVAGTVGGVKSARGRDGPGGPRATGRAPPERVTSTDEIDPRTIRPRPP